MKKNPDSEVLKSTFLALGLSDKEARVYGVLLELGKSSAGAIVRASGLKRGITYAVLYQLEQYGLVRTIKQDKKIFFQLEPPVRLTELAHKRRQEVDQVELNLTSILPGLNSQYKLTIGKPTIQYFEGEDGLRKVFEDIYAAGPDKKVYGCIDIEKANAVFPDYVARELIPKRIKNKVVAYSLLADSPQAKIVKAKDSTSLRKSVLVDKNTFPLPAEIDIYDDKVALLSFEKGEFIGIVITNEAFARTLRSVFALSMGHNKAD